MYKFFSADETESMLYVVHFKSIYQYYPLEICYDEEYAMLNMTRVCFFLSMYLYAMLKLMLLSF